MINDLNLEIEQNPLILIVDDIPKNLQLLSSILSAEGYQIAFASNGHQALSVVESTSPDLILLDIMMPEMDGYEVCSKLKQNPKTAHIPIIFLTGRVETEDVVKGFQVGAVDYITKPFNTVELLVRVKTHIDLKLSKDELFKKNEQLTSYKSELEQLVATKDKFFSIIAHDLRGPFSGFLGLSEILMNEYELLEKEDVIQISESMNKAAKRLFEFLENLLEWSSTQTGKLELHPTNLDISTIANKTIAILSTTANEKKISLSSNIPSNTYVFADSNIAFTILRNLVSNSIKFTNSDGYIIISTTESENFISISVADNGIGMNDDIKAKLFKVDKKYSSHGTNNETGTGLGLILCKELVEKSGGTISVESTPNIGSTFTFSLPKVKIN